MTIIARLLFALSILIPAFSLQATTWRSEFECFVRLHYTEVAYGKTVSQVMAHIGIEQQKSPSWMGGSAATEWSNVQDVTLQLQGQAFLGQAVLKGEAGKIGPYFKNFVVQYWVNFADGTSIISPVYPIPVQAAQVTYSWDDYEKARAAIVADTSEQAFWEGTSCQQLAKITMG